MEEVQGNSGGQEAQEPQMAQLDSEDTFFDDLERAVNGQVYDQDQQEEAQGNPMQDQATPQQANPAQQAPQGEVPNQAPDYEKRYKDSSREANKMYGALQSLKPYMPILNAMKKDPNLVNHVRGYFSPGQQDPKGALLKQLDLGEDFEFDMNDAMSDPKSGSAKYMNTIINGMVDSKVQNITQQQMAKNAQAQKRFTVNQEIQNFQKKHGFTDEQMNAIQAKAKNRKLSMEDIYMLVSKDEAQKNIANNTKKDMMAQMQNVRTIQPSASNANNSGQKAGLDDALFDSLVDLDSGVDDLFG